MKTIYDVADELNARIEITRYPKQGRRFTASLRIYTNVGSTGFNLIGEKFDTLGAYGQGLSPKEAINDLTGMISGKAIEPTRSIFGGQYQCPILSCV